MTDWHKRHCESPSLTATIWHWSGDQFRSTPDPDSPFGLMGSCVCSSWGRSSEDYIYSVSLIASYPEEISAIRCGCGKQLLVWTDWRGTPKWLLLSLSQFNAFRNKRVYKGAAYSINEVRSIDRRPRCIGV